MKSLKYNSSEIRFGNLANTEFNSLISSKYRKSKKVIITDENVSDIWISDLITANDSLKDAEIIQLPSGEENKVLEICAHVWNALSEYQITRKDLIINFGGGVITDMGGFIASTFKRGLPFINIPTTLLSQVDASVGGKTGIDLGPYKNQIGVFADADYVFVDNRFLGSLEEQELISGYAEMLKHGLIADADYWNRLKDINPLVHENLIESIYHSVQLKKNVVEQDHKESGLRKILNFGHTIGHGIEGFFLQNGNPVPHGYAVAWGMIAEAYISQQLKLISEKDLEEIKSNIDKTYPKAELTDEQFNEILSLMQNDKKNSEGKIQFSLLNQIGEANFDQEVDETLIIEALNYIK